MNISLMRTSSGSKYGKESKTNFSSIRTWVCALTTRTKCLSPKKVKSTFKRLKGRSDRKGRNIEIVNKRKYRNWLGNSSKITTLQKYMKIIYPVLLRTMFPNSSSIPMKSFFPKKREKRLSRGSIRWKLECMITNKKAREEEWRRERKKL